MREALLVTSDLMRTSVEQGVWIPDSLVVSCDSAFEMLSAIPSADIASRMDQLVVCLDNLWRLGRSN